MGAPSNSAKSVRDLGATSIDQLINLLGIRKVENAYTKEIADLLGPVDG